MASLLIDSKIILAIYVGTAELSLNLTNAPWLSKVVKIIRPSLNPGLNTRQSYNGAASGVTPGGAVAKLVPNTLYELTCAVYNGWALADFSRYPVLGSGGAATAYPFTSTLSVAITHGLNRAVAVSIVAPNGTPILAQVTATSANVSTLSFNALQAGTALIG